MPPKLTYAIKFVADMDRAVRFHRDILGLPLKFQSPHWSEFITGDTTLALHPASEKNPVGRVELGLRVEDLKAFHQEMLGQGVKFTAPPAKQPFGFYMAQFVDSEGDEYRVSGGWPEEAGTAHP